jgi:hypothetical protein
MLNPDAQAGHCQSMKRRISPLHSRHSGQAKRDPESSPRLGFESPGYRIESGMTAKTKSSQKYLKYFWL